MKKITLFMSLTALLILSACGGNSGNATNKDSGQNQSKSVIYKSSEGILTCTLPSDWKSNGNGPDNFKMYGGIYKWSSKDIYKDIKHNYGFEPIDKVTKVQVDGLPALTIKEKFMQNVEKIKRTWMVYNGIDIIEIVVQSNTANWNDNVAKNIISKVKINKRAKNVTLSKSAEKDNNKNNYIKPQSFPEEYFKSIQGVFSSKKLLNENNINNGISMFKEIQNIDTTNMHGQSDEQMTKLFDNIAAKYGFSDLNNAINQTVTPAFLSVSILSMSSRVQSGKFGNYDFIKDFIRQNPISYDDLKFSYDNWDKIMELVTLTASKK